MCPANVNTGLFLFSLGHLLETPKANSVFLFFTAVVPYDVFYFMALHSKCLGGK